MSYRWQFLKKLNQKSTRAYLPIVAAVSTVGIAVSLNQKQKFRFMNLHIQQSQQAEALAETVYRRTEMQKHKTIQDQIWVSYQDGVYDITDFVKVHPGGADKLMMAAGGSIDPFWEMYSFHKVDEVKDLLNKYRIGELHPDDRIKPEDLVDFSDMQTDDIDRSKNLVVLQDFPYCAETNSMFLTDHFATPPNEMYCRNHNLIPQFDEDFEEEFELELTVNSKDSQIAGKKLKNYSLEQIRNFPKQHSVTTTISCAGNRRSHSRSRYPTIKGLSWTVGAISNNTYKGVLIRDLLLDSGFTEEQLASPEFQKKHLVSTGLDCDFQGVHFSSSIPISRVLDPKNEVTLAYAQDGEKIPDDHGYPLRLVVPGFIGIRNAKWVSKIEISDEEATSHMQRRDYKWIEEADWSKIDLSKYPALNGTVQNSLICYPKEGDTITLAKDQRSFVIKGYAHGEGEKGTKIVKVQVSIDNGETWNDAKLTHQEVKPKDTKTFSWALWKYHVKCDKFKGESQFEMSPMVRSISDDGFIQQGDWDKMFNVRGVFNTTAHQINVKVQRSQ